MMLGAKKEFSAWSFKFWASVSGSLFCDSNKAKSFTHLQKSFVKMNVPLSFVSKPRQVVGIRLESSVYCHIRTLSL